MKISIAIDMDEVISCYTKKVLETLETETGLRVGLKGIQGKFLSYSLDPNYVEIATSYPYRKGFFRDLEVIPHSQRVIRSMIDYFDIYIVTACMQHPNSLNDKLAWLNDHFPFIPFQRIIFCGEKLKISTEYLIDDHPKHLELFKGTPLLFTAFHNIHENRFKRFDDWLQLESFFYKLME